MESHQERPDIIKAIILRKRCEMHRLYCLVFLVCFGAMMPAMAQECHMTDGWMAMGSAQIALESAGEQHLLSVRVADDSQKRAAGYQWICEQDSVDSAVLFVFPEKFYSAFHMRNVFVPLDIYFFDELGHQVGAMLMPAEPPGQGIKPHYYSPSAEFKFALEIPRFGAHDSTASPLAFSLVLASLPINLD